MTGLIEEIRKYVIERSEAYRETSEDHYDFWNEHIRYVYEEAVSLAEKYGADPDKALLAAKYHDICRKWDDERMNAFVTLTQLGDQYMNNINLSHSKAAAHVARVAFKITDEDILNAISFHTTGRAGMSLLEKILYLADYMEPTRDFPGVEALREITWIDLDRALLLAFNMCIEELIRENKSVCADSREARDYIARQLNEPFPQQEV